MKQAREFRAELLKAMPEGKPEVRQLIVLPGELREPLTRLAEVMGVSVEEALERAVREGLGKFEKRGGAR